MNSPWYIGMDLAAPDDDFDIGDVVTLRGQPQLMTVEDVCECGSVSVVWFAGNEDDGWSLYRDTFDADMLDNLDAEDE